MTQPLGSLQLQVEFGNQQALVAMGENPDLDSGGLTLEWAAGATLE